MAKETLSKLLVDDSVKTVTMQFLMKRVDGRWRGVTMIGGDTIVGPARESAVTGLQLLFQVLGGQPGLAAANPEQIQFLLETHIAGFSSPAEFFNQK